MITQAPTIPIARLASMAADGALDAKQALLGRLNSIQLGAAVDLAQLGAILDAALLPNSFGNHSRAGLGLLAALQYAPIAAATCVDNLQAAAKGEPAFKEGALRALLVVEDSALGAFLAGFLADRSLKPDIRLKIAAKLNRSQHTEDVRSRVREFVRAELTLTSLFDTFLNISADLPPLVIHLESPDLRTLPSLLSESQRSYGCSRERDCLIWRILSHCDLSGTLVPDLAQCYEQEPIRGDESGPDSWPERNVGYQAATTLAQYITQDPVLCAFLTRLAVAGDLEKGIVAHALAQEASSHPEVALAVEIIERERSLPAANNPHFMRSGAVMAAGMRDPSFREALVKLACSGDKALINDAARTVYALGRPDPLFLRFFVRCAVTETGEASQAPPAAAGTLLDSLTSIFADLRYSDKTPSNEAGAQPTKRAFEPTTDELITFTTSSNPQLRSDAYRSLVDHALSNEQLERIAQSARVEEYAQRQNPIHLFCKHIDLPHSREFLVEVLTKNMRAKDHLQRVGDDILAGEVVPNLCRYFDEPEVRSALMKYTSEMRICFTPLLELLTQRVADPQVQALCVQIVGEFDYTNAYNKGINAFAGIALALTCHQHDTGVMNALVTYLCRAWGACDERMLAQIRSSMLASIQSQDSASQELFRIARAPDDEQGGVALQILIRASLTVEDAKKLLHAVTARYSRYDAQFYSCFPIAEYIRQGEVPSKDAVIEAAQYLQANSMDGRLRKYAGELLLNYAQLSSSSV